MLPFKNEKSTIGDGHTDSSTANELGALQRLEPEYLRQICSFTDLVKTFKD